MQAVLGKPIYDVGVQVPDLIPRWIGWVRIYQRIRYQAFLKRLRAALGQFLQPDFRTFEDLK